MYRIRRAIAGDTAAIIGVWEGAVRATHHFLGEDGIAFYRSRLPEYLKTVELYVYDGGRGIRGFYGINGEKLEMLFVMERGSGIGTLLLTDAIERGVRSVDVNEENLQATGFYYSKGFRLSGRSESDGEGKPHPLLLLSLQR